MGALAAIEKAILVRAARMGQTELEQVEKEFKTYQGIKARALRPGTEHEGTTAMKLAITRALKLVFG